MSAAKADAVRAFSARLKPCPDYNASNFGIQVHSVLETHIQLDALVNISTALGCRARVDLDAAWAAFRAANWT